MVLFESKGLIVFIALIIVSIVYILLGYYSHVILLNSNPCKMTYNVREKSNVALCGKECNYKLYKITNAHNNKLNKQPVLFIPGHLGSADQARSFSSYMHNDDDYFQYFALDFSSHNVGGSGLHGTDIIAQATVTNEAITSINKLYLKAGITLGIDNSLKKNASASRHETINYPKGIMIVGHSIGGFVARTALLLSNHPVSVSKNSDTDIVCPVRDIVQLSSPNTAPPHSPDATLDTLYSRVHQAWTHSYMNRTSCSTSSIVGNISKEGVRILIDCPSQCVANVRLLSISGGAIDGQVSPRLSKLHSLYPVRLPRPKIPSNTTANVSATSTSYLSVALNSIGHLISTMVSSLPSNNSIVDINVTSNNVRTNATDSISTISETAESETVEYSSVNETVDVILEANGDTDAINSIDNSDNTTSVDADIPVNMSINDSAIPTIENASMHLHYDNLNSKTLSYVSPSGHRVSLGADLPIFSIRTSQLQSVGFPIDHAALLWCHQLLQTVTDSMRGLSKSAYKSNNEFIWSDVIQIKESVLNDDDSKVELSQRLNRLDVSLLERTYDQSAELDSGFFQRKLYYKHGYIIGVLLHGAHTFVIQHLFRILACYLVISLLAITVLIARRLCGHYPLSSKSSNSYLLMRPLSNWSVVKPWLLCGMDLWYPALVWSAYQLPRTSNTPSLHQLPPYELVTQAIMLIIVVKMAFDLMFNFGGFASLYLDYFYWLVSFFFAVVMRAITLISIEIMRKVVGYIIFVVRAILRFTIWNKAIRKRVKAMMPKLLKGDLYKVTVNGAILLVASIALWISIYIRTEQRRADIRNNGFYYSNMLIVVSYAILLSSVIAGILHSPFSPTMGSKKRSNDELAKLNEDHFYYTELTLLYFPLVAIAFPSVWSSFRALFGPLDPYIYSVESYEIFGMDRVVYCGCILLVSMHYWGTRFNIELLRNVRAFRWLQEVMGPHVLYNVWNLYPSCILNGGTCSSVDGVVTSSSDDAGRSSKKLGGQCLHEDGGKRAIFERVEGDSNQNKCEDVEPVQAVSTGVVMGTTYKVISCGCAKDYSLKDIALWCEWCRCLKCGGKEIPSSYRAALFEASAGSDNTSGKVLGGSTEKYNEAVEISLTVVLPIVLITSVAMSFIILESNPHRYIYVTAVIAIAHLICRCVER